MHSRRRALPFVNLLECNPRPAPITIDSDPEDPPVEHSSDDETEGVSTNLKPTRFQLGGRHLDSTPNRSDRVVKESPGQTAAAPAGVFSGLMQEFGLNSSPVPSNSVDDMASAYGNSSRRPRPALANSSVGRPKVNANAYNTINDIHDHRLENKVIQIQQVLTGESVQRCMDALKRCKGNVEDAKNWLAEDEEQDAPGEDDVDELSSVTPEPRRGIARPTANQTSQPTRPAAKQSISAQQQTIAERYGGATQVARKASIDDEPPKPRKRLQQGRRRPASPILSSPVQLQPPPQPRQKQQTVVISDDEDEVEVDSDSGIVEDEPEISDHDQRLLKFFNECSVENLADLSAQTEAVAKLVVSKRPFADLDAVRMVSTTAAETKSGKKSKARPIGEKMVDTCSEVWISYDAIDDLVQQCETMSKPIQEALKTWGVNTDAGELQLTNLDEAHDSGVGTPASSAPSDEVVPLSKDLKKASQKGRFLVQPETMNPEFSLKDYQLVGLNWLHLLWTQRISCILADDMGLGKTYQVIAFLAQLQQEQVDGCALVIVPGSTLENWLREFQRFAPSLVVQPYYGSQNERPELQVYIEHNLDTIDVVVTTYDMAVKQHDAKFLRKTVDPLVCIYDEAHNLRNAQSDRYRQLMRFNPQWRVLLTGTPLQNNLKELISILAFIMPDMFRDKKDELDYIFQHKATTKEPAENAALLSAQRIAKARSIITPFILRRKKHQVLDLPTKHSRVEYCDMTPSQVKYYRTLFEDAQQIFAEEHTGGRKKISNILMALRKAAMHPLLGRNLYDDSKIEKMTDICVANQAFGGNNRRDLVRTCLVGEGANGLKGGDYTLHMFCDERPYLKKFALKKKPWMDSGKVAKFEQLITAFAKNGDRVLVFSQFTTMMDILESVLETLGIKFMRLDGSTSMQIRQDMIDKFTQDESIPVFMLSTRAGGAGINLAAANKVIIFDSGFNPQDDIQAENRAHRVGQTREVEVIRLVTRDTIEEQIHALGQSKLALDARVAGEGANEADDGKKAEKAGEQMVERMFRAQMSGGGGEGESAVETDLRDAFKDGLESAGLKVASKQAQY